MPEVAPTMMIFCIWLSYRKPKNRCILIVHIPLHMFNELSYDRFNKNVSHTYRLTATTIGQSFPLAGAPLATAIKARKPGVKYSAAENAKFLSSALSSCSDSPFQ